MANQMGTENADGVVQVNLPRGIVDPSKRWAVLIKPSKFWIDMWEWHAMPYVADNTLGDTEFGGVCSEEPKAKEHAIKTMVRYGIKEAVLLGPDNMEDDE